MPRSQGYVLAFDFGLRHIGVALGQGLTGTARGLVTLPAKQGKPRWFAIERLLKEYEPAVVVVGLPLNMDGSESDMASRARTFAAQLAGRITIPVYMHDERLTSNAAKSELADAGLTGRARTEHELAACLIAESWLREQR